MQQRHGMRAQQGQCALLCVQGLLESCRECGRVLLLCVLVVAPGVYAARYCGRHGDDEANNVKLLAELEDLEPEKRSACFVSAVCFCLPDGRHFTYMGRCPGWVGLEPVGENGFGYDPIFIPDEVGTADGKCLPNEENRSYAQLQDWEKDAISHRGRALRLMQAKLADDLAAKA